MEMKTLYCAGSGKEQCRAAQFISDNLPHKKLIRGTSIWFAVFLVALFSDKAMGFRVIEPFFVFLGLCITIGFYLVAYFQYQDYKKVLSGEE